MPTTLLMFIITFYGLVCYESGPFSFLQFLKTLLQNATCEAKDQSPQGHLILIFPIVLWFDEWNCMLSLVIVEKLILRVKCQTMSAMYEIS